MTLSARRAQQEGRIRLHQRFASRWLSTPRDVVVYVPPGYDSSSAAYPVLYMQDGQNLFDPETAFMGQDWHAGDTADERIEAGTVEPLIIVGVYNTGVRRISEYTPTRDARRRKGGKGDRYARMLARELKPLIDGAYRTKRGACDTGVGGSSLGGLASLQAGLLFPAVFGKMAVMSPSVWWDRGSIVGMVERYRAKPRAGVWLDAGTAEGDSPGEVIGGLRLLRDALLAKGWDPAINLHYCEAAGAGHNEAAWAARLGGVLEYLFGRADRSAEILDSSRARVRPSVR